ncbi:MAG: SGNH/GDSL hydrolase family protein [Bacteroidota bacterium]|nr:SGNH/GDSL hydrolase family protein [Bacteroidota bacterium]
MRSKNKICLFFIALALVYWNPLSFYFIYNGTAIYSFKFIHFLFWLAFVCGMGALYRVFKNKAGNKWVNVLFSISMAGILFSFIVLVNGLAGLLGTVKKINKAKEAGLLFEPGSRIRYQTVEFNYVAEINSFGLRDREIKKDKANKYRILCFGDSWTYGWGVNSENSWPGKLEQFLKSRGIENAEVINCGRPGLFTSSYKENIEKIIPILKPDLVLLGVLQLDDLAQIYESDFPVSAGKQETIPVIRKMTYAIKSFLFYSVRNILTLAGKNNPPEVTVSKNWQSTVRSMVSNLSYTQLARYNTLNDSVKTLLQNGDLNPGVLFYYINFPGRVTLFNNPDDPATQFALTGMNKDLQAIKSTCVANHSDLVFINLPTHYFTGHQVIIGADDILNSYYENNNKIDSMYRSVALKNATPYIELTREFRKLEDKSAYFFRYDAHPTEKGYEKIADLIGQYLVDSSRLIEKK